MNKARKRKLHSVYAEIPKINCKGKCTDYCGAIGMEKGEWEELKKRCGVEPSVREDLSCSLLQNGKCSAYEDRPLICFVPETWVFTETGPKRIKEILAGEFVYGFDGNLHKVLATNSHIHNGLITQVQHTGTQIDCWATSDHRWLCASQKDKRKIPVPYWKEAKDLIPKKQHKLGDYLCYPREFTDNLDLHELNVKEFIGGEIIGDRIYPVSSGKMLEGRQKHSIPLKFIVDDEFLFMLGLYLAEGNSSNQAAVFTMHKEELPILETVGNYLNKLKIPTSFRGYRNTSHLTISSCLFARLMSALAGSGAPNKAINERLFGLLSHRQKWLIFEGWNIGDGRKMQNEKEISVATSSEKLAVQMSFISLANGLFPRIYKYQSTNRSIPYYDVHLFPSNFRECKPGFGTRNMFDEMHVYSPVKEVSSKAYNGPVIDLQIENAESFVTSSGIAHNCRLWGVLPAMTCPHGCEPERWLTPNDFIRFFAKVKKLVGDGRDYKNCDDSVWQNDLEKKRGKITKFILGDK